MPELVRYDAMCHAIAEAYAIDEVKDIRDRAIALEHYARLAHNIEAERQCCEIRLRAERKAGQLLRESERAKAGRPPKNPSTDTRDYPPAPTLRELGITYDQASKWQHLAGISEPQFEALLADEKHPTTNGMIRATAPPVITPVSSEALWLWGRLRDFDRMGLLAMTPAEVMTTMTPTMMQDVLAEAPRVIEWLKRIGEDNQ